MRASCSLTRSCRSSARQLRVASSTASVVAQHPRELVGVQDHAVDDAGFEPRQVVVQIVGRLARRRAAQRGKGLLLQQHQDVPRDHRMLAFPAFLRRRLAGVPARHLAERGRRAGAGMRAGGVVLGDRAGRQQAMEIGARAEVDLEPAATARPQAPGRLDRQRVGLGIGHMIGQQDRAAAVQLGDVGPIGVVDMPQIDKDRPAPVDDLLGERRHDMRQLAALEALRDRIAA